LLLNPNPHCCGLTLLNAGEGEFSVGADLEAKVGPLKGENFGFMLWEK